MSSRERALKAINLEATDRIPSFEFLSNPDFETQFTGIDAYQHPLKARLRTFELLDIDMIGMGGFPLTDEPPGTQFEEGESSKLNEEGHRVVRWGAGATMAWDFGYFFKNMDDVLKFDPISFFLGTEEQKVVFEDLRFWQRHFHLPVEEMAKEFNDFHKGRQELMGDRALVGAGFIRTLFYWPLMLFGWEKFAELAYCHTKEFERIWDACSQISMKVMKAYSMTDTKWFFSHDDICYSKGPIFNPKWYRQYLYPYYEKIWAPLKEKGIKIVFVSDGILDDVVDDVLAAGADGFLTEPGTDLERFTKKYKDRGIFVGNIDGLKLLGDKDTIRKEVERCTRFGKECPGYFYCVSNDIVWNIPPDNVKYYFDCCRELGRRGNK
jgi:hypothetical protein